MRPVPLVAAAAPEDDAVSGVSFRPVDLLRLAILGKAVRDGIELEQLTAEVQSMAGASWQPAAEVVLAGLQRLTADGDIRIEPSVRPRHLVMVRLTARGALRLDALMKRDVRHTPEPLFHAVMMIKIALVDILPIPQRWRQVTALLERLKRDLQALRGEARPGESGHEAAPCWSYARQFDENRLEGEIRWLGGLAEMAAGPLGALPRDIGLTGPLR